MEISVSALAAYVIGAFMTYVALLFSYRLLLHPLRRYPGPFLARVSDAYAGLHAASMSSHVRTREDILKYGPVIRYGPNRLIFSSVTAMHDIYLNERVAKSHVYKNSAVVDGVWNLFNVIDKEVHRFKRRLIGQVISERSMRTFEPTMQEQINIFIGILREESSSSSADTTKHGTSVNMTQKLKRLGIDTVCLLAFGYPLNTQTEAQYRFLIDAHVFGNFRTNLFMQFPLIKKLRIYSFLELFFAREVRKYFSVMETMIARRVAEDKHVRHDLYSIVADDMNPTGEKGKDLRHSEIWAEAGFFFPAGGETTATLLAATFFYLSRERNRAAYDRLAAEIRSSFRTVDEIKAGPTLSGCKYLRACLDETMRMSPPAPGTLWREQQHGSPSSSSHSQPWIVDGHVIPAGVQVGVSPYVLHHDEDIFPNSFTFDPGRWSADAHLTREQKARMAAAFQPFSIGARSCAGKAMAYLQSSLVLAKTMWYFDFRAAKGEEGKLGGGNNSSSSSSSLGIGRGREDEFQLYDILSSTHDGPNLVFTPREEETWLS